jgi:hypothetical protein
MAQFRHFLLDDGDPYGSPLDKRVFRDTIKLCFCLPWRFSKPLRVDMSTWA